MREEKNTSTREKYISIILNGHFVKRLMGLGMLPPLFRRYIDTKIEMQGRVLISYVKTCKNTHFLFTFKITRKIEDDKRGKNIGTNFWNIRHSRNISSVSPDVETKIKMNEFDRGRQELQNLRAKAFVILTKK